MIPRQTGLLHLSREFERVRKIALGEQIGKSVDDIAGDVQRFADFPRGAAPTIGDHVGGHGRSMLAVATVDFLDDTFAAIAAG